MSYDYSKVIKFNKVLQEKNLEKLEDSTLRKLLQRVFDYNNAEKYDKISEMLSLLYYNENWELKNKIPNKVEKGSYPLNSLFNLESITDILTRRKGRILFVYTSDKNKLMGI